MPSTSTALIFLPTTSRSRSRRTTSTSGSSGIAPPVAAPPPASRAVVRARRRSSRAAATRRAPRPARPASSSGPRPRRTASPPSSTVAKNRFEWSGPSCADLVARQLVERAAPRAPGAASCSRRRRARRLLADALAEQPRARRARAASSPPSRYTAAITASIASARIDGLARPPDASSPLPRRSAAPSSSSRGELGEHLGVHDRRRAASRARPRAARGTRRYTKVGDDEARARRRRGTRAARSTPRGARRSTSGAPAPAASSDVVAERPAERDLQPRVEVGRCRAGHLRAHRRPGIVIAVLPSRATT